MMDQSLVVDVGSYTIKAGFSDEKTPDKVIPSVCGKIRKKYADKFSKESYYGQESIDHIEYVSLRKVVDHGHITNFEDFELLLKCVLDNFGLESLNETCILFSEPVLSPSNLRQKLIEIAFETFDAHSLNVSPSALLSIYGAGEITGTVLDIGDGITQCVPIIEGYVEKHTVRRNDFGGEEIANHLQKLLAHAGYQFSTRKHSTFVYEIKEKLCFCSFNPIKDESRTDLLVEYTLPDGYVIAGGSNAVSLETERFYPVESLFNPTIIDSECPNVVNLIWDSIQSCPMDKRIALSSKIILAGGSTKFQNFPERLEIELKNVAPKNARDIVKVIAKEGREYLPWAGGACFSSESIRQANDSAWITCDEWLECGSAAAQKLIQI